VGKDNVNKESKGQEGFQDIHPTLIEFREYIRKADKSLSQSTSELFEYIQPDRTESAFYQRIQKMLQDEIKNPTDEELQAIERWLHVERNAHIYGRLFFNLKNYDKKVEQLNRYLQSGYIDKTQANKIIKALRTLNPLSDSHI